MQHHILFLVGLRSTEKKLLAGLQSLYEVTVAPTRREGMCALTEASIDLVLVDVPSLRFDIQRFYDSVPEREPLALWFWLLGKGTRLDQMPKAQGHLRYPFTERQLLRRLARALPESQGALADWHGLQLDTERYLLSWETQQIPVTPKQASLALAFLRLPETLISRVQLMQQVWGTDFMGDTRTLDVHIHWLRQSLKQIEAPFTLETARGQGYRLIAAPDTSE